MNKLAFASLAVVTVCAAACPQVLYPPHEEPPPCGVTASNTVEQADTAAPQLASFIGFVLDDALGGQTCIPGIAADCAEQLEACAGELSAATGTTTTVVIDIENRSQLQVTFVGGLAIDGDCGWSIADGSGFDIDDGTTVPVEVVFTAGAAGVCDSEFVVNVFADNVEGSEVRIPLRATVTE